jgi:hypothetical protein
MIERGVNKNSIHSRFSRNSIGINRFCTAIALIFLCAGISFSQWEPGQKYDLNAESYTYNVLWETDNAIYSDTRINEYREYHHIVASYKNNSYIVYIDNAWRPVIVKVDPEKDIATEALLDSTDYHILENDSHQFFAIGVDKDGYIHVFGDMHNFPRYNSDHLPERYSAARCMYWRSDAPEDISSFTWYGAEFGDCPWGTSFTYPHMFYDQNGELFFSARVRSETAKQYAAVNYNRYNTETKQWELLGGTNAYNNQCLFWEDNGEGGGSYSKPCRSLHFDLNNRAHFASSLYNSDRDKPFPEKNNKYNTDLVYASSDDLGKTFQRADGSIVEVIPMRIDVPSQRPDLVLSNTIIDATATHAVTDYQGNPYIIGNEYEEDGTEHTFCYVYDRQAGEWVDVSGKRPVSKGYLLADRAGVITFFTKGTYAMHRFFDFGESRITNLPYFDLGIDRRHLLESGDIRGIPKRKKATDSFQLVEVRIDRPVSYPEMGNLLSSDAQLLSLASDKGVMYPPFSPGRYRYSLYLAEGDQAPEISAVPKRPGAKVTGEGIQNDYPGMAVIEVLAEDSVTSSTYEINMITASRSDFQPEGDAYLRNGDYAADNFNEQLIRIKSAANPNFEREGLIKFTAEGVEHDLVNAAFIQLYVTDVKEDPVIQFYDFSTDWDETTISWESAGNTGQDNDPLQSNSINHHDDSSRVLVNITPYLKEILKSKTDFGVRIRSSVNASSLAFSSKEHPDTAQHPALLLFHGTSLSSDARLKSIQTDAGTMSPAFHTDSLEYTLELPAGTLEVEISAETNHTMAWVEGSGKIPAWKKEVILEVTAEDGVTQNEYRIAFTEPGTKVESFDQSLQFRMFPNPATRWISIEMNDASNITVSIHNMLGQQLKKTNLNREHTRINLEDLQQGMYILILQRNNNIVASEKLIIN